MGKVDITALKQDPRSVKTTHTPVKVVNTTTVKKKVGRPKVKEGEFKTINISIPVHVLERMEVAKLKYGNNLTAYVNAVILADLNANYGKYLELQSIINS